MPTTPLNELQAFALVARLRSFRKAAAELGLSPSALSHALRNLESRLGVRLLNRTTRSVAPTEAGQSLLNRLSPALLDIAGALDEMNAFRQSPMGTLRINAPLSGVKFVLLPLAERFLLENPGMKLELVAENRLVDIVAEGFDAGVRFGERVDQDMVAVPIGPPQRFVVAASPAYLERHGIAQSPRELTAHHCIRQRYTSGHYLGWHFARGEEALEIEVAGPLAVSDMSLAASAAARGLGLAFMYSEYAEPYLADGRLVTILDDWRPAETGLFLYYPSHRLVPAGLRAFIDLAREVYPSNRP